MPEGFPCDWHKKNDDKDQEKMMTPSNEQLSIGTEAFALVAETIDLNEMDRFDVVSLHSTLFAEDLQAAVADEDEEDEDEDDEDADDEDDDLDEEDDLDDEDEDDEDEDEDELEYEDDDEEDEDEEEDDEE